MTPDDADEPLAAYAERVIGHCADLAATVEAIDDQALRDQLRSVCTEMVWDVVMLSAGTTRLLLRQ